MIQSTVGYTLWDWHAEISVCQSYKRKKQNASSGRTARVAPCHVCKVTVRIKFDPRVCAPDAFCESIDEKTGRDIFWCEKCADNLWTENLNNVAC